MRAGRRRVLVVVCVFALVTFVSSASIVVVLLEVSATAPPPVEHRDLDYEDPPGAVVSNGLVNLQSTSFTQDVTVEDTGDRADVSPLNGTGVVFEDGPATTTEMQLRMNNPARRYSATVSHPAFAGDETVRFYAESPMDGYVGKRTNDSWRPDWEGDRQLGYRTWRTQLRPTLDLSDADATVVDDDVTTYVVRITDDRVAMDVGYPGTPGPVGTRIPTLTDANANLTVEIDKRSGFVRSATFRYYHRPGDRSIRADHEFTAYGTTSVERPIGTLPPEPETMLYRLDLGLWAVDPFDWFRAALYSCTVLGVTRIASRKMGWFP